MHDMHRDRAAVGPFICRIRPAGGRLSQILERDGPQEGHSPPRSAVHVDPTGRWDHYDRFCPFHAGGLLERPADLEESPRTGRSRFELEAKGSPARTPNGRTTPLNERRRHRRSGLHRRSGRQRSGLHRAIDPHRCPASTDDAGCTAIRAAPARYSIRTGLLRSILANGAQTIANLCQWGSPGIPPRLRTRSPPA
jgi:hypothetical protein